MRTVFKFSISSLLILLDYSKVHAFLHKEKIEYIENIKNVVQYIELLCDDILKMNYPDGVRLLCSMLTIHKNVALRDEIQSYFTVPVFAKLSESRLLIEAELCQDSRLVQAVKLIKFDKDTLLTKKTTFLYDLINCLVVSKDEIFITESIKLISSLLSQPSFRRFVKPLLQDTLFLSQIKSKCTDINIYSELEYIFFYPINEVSGVFFENRDEYIKHHFIKLKNYRENTLKFAELDLFSYMPEECFLDSFKFKAIISQLSKVQLRLILSAMGCANFSDTLTESVMIEYILLEHIIRVDYFKEHKNVLPTEVFSFNSYNNLFFKSCLKKSVTLRPLTIESLSFSELIQRHNLIIRAGI